MSTVLDYYNYMSILTGLTIEFVIFAIAFAAFAMEVSPFAIEFVSVEVKFVCFAL